MDDKLAMENVICVWGENDAVSKGSGRNAVNALVDVNKLKENLGDFSKKIEMILSELRSNICEYKLEEIEIHAGISASGEVKLIGKIEAGATGGISLTYKRQSDD